MNVLQSPGSNTKSEISKTKFAVSLISVIAAGVGLAAIKHEQTQKFYDEANQFYEDTTPLVREDGFLGMAGLSTDGLDMTLRVEENCEIPYTSINVGDGSNGSKEVNYSTAILYGVDAYDNAIEEIIFFNDRNEFERKVLVGQKCVDFAADQVVAREEQYYEESRD